MIQAMASASDHTSAGASAFATQTVTTSATVRSSSSGIVVVAMHRCLDGTLSRSLTPASRSPQPPHKMLQPPQNESCAPKKNHRRFNGATEDQQYAQSRGALA